MKRIAYLILCLSASSYAVKFPVDYVCDYGNKLTVPVLVEATPKTHFVNANALCPDCHRDAHQGALVLKSANITSM
ncbi:hypothetical protein F3J38_26580 [Pantoea sp. Acro-805]|uniref:Uncharacterized protein n=1 Tax=Candidatus Pantoea formicae TaxID=2608355 RepID=A0ABX0R2W7_9GAMM|nr:hypothetical protein [Pantoea formicae]NIF03572.1 hypothetical protein [Pantoea formicae]